MLTEKELQFLKELNERQIPFMIVGMSAAVLQDVPLTTVDVDLWFKALNDQDMAAVAKNCGAIYIPTNLAFQMPPRLGGQEFEKLDIVVSVVGLSSFDEEYKHAIDVDLQGVSVKVLPLERIILSKQTLKRPKDLAVLPVMQTVLAKKNSSA